MCTLGAKKINGKIYLFKNRDLEEYKDTKVIQENNNLVITDEDNHYEGVNSYGIGIIEATLSPYKDIEYIKPSKVAKEALNQNNLKDAIDIIKKSNTSVNIIISDGKETYIIEKTPDEFAKTKIEDSGVITNFGINVDKRNGSKRPHVRKWQEDRYKRGKKIIKNIKSIEDIKRFLSDKEGYPMSICSGGDWFIPTRASFIYDMEEKKVFFCNTAPDKGKFVEYK
jgi:hypothetical protein